VSVDRLIPQLWHTPSIGQSRALRHARGSIHVDLTETVCIHKL
jgi:hypothetical protein